MKKLLVLMVGLCLVASTAMAKEAAKQDVIMIEDSQGLFDNMGTGLFGVAQAGTTWIGQIQDGNCATAVQPGVGGVWDFDCSNGGEYVGICYPCPDGIVESKYLKDHSPVPTNPTYLCESQGWTSEDVYAQKGLWWHAEDFTDPGFACSTNPIAGTYSAWCGKVAADPGECFNDPPGYGHNWSQWLCKTVTLDPVTPRLKYKFNSDTEPGFDYAYVFIDGGLPDSCGYNSETADTLRCYDGPHGTTAEDIDLTNVCADPDLCDDAPTCDYSGDSVKICFVVVSDGAWDDEDGDYATCDGAMTVDDIFIDTAPSSGDSITTDFETGTLEGWIRCGGFSPGDWVAIRDANEFINNDVCGFDNCDMSYCVLAYWNPNIPGQYGNGGHYDGDFHKRAWSPTVDFTAIAPRGYCIYCDRYGDLPIANWIFYRYYCKYVQDVNCPVGAWSPAVSDNYVYYMPIPACDSRIWGFSQFVPTDADSVKIGLSAWNGCNVWEVPCTNGNESPVFDNVRLGYWDLSAPQASLRAVDNYTDAFPESDSLIVPAEVTDWGYPAGSPEIIESTPTVLCHPNAKNNTGLIDCANNKSQEGYFLRLADSLVVSLTAPDVYAELCFKIRPGPCTDTGDLWWGRMGLSPVNCLVTEDYACVRMDTAFAAGDGDTASAYEYQIVFEDYYATMIHEDDIRYMGEGEEIFPDSLFTPGTKIYYAIRTSFLPGPGPYAWVPFGADMTDLNTLYEVEVLPNRCKLADEMSCLLYYDYYNRGAQQPIEELLDMLGREWDRCDLRAESSHQANGIGNRLLGAGRYALVRGPIGPSNEHLAQYTVMLVNNGNFSAGVTFSDGGTGTPDDPSNDIGFMDQWINEGRWKGLWLSGNNIATDFATATAGPKPVFLNNTMGVALVASSYRQIVGHPVGRTYACRLLYSNRGFAAIENYFDQCSELVYRLQGSGCPQRYDYDVMTTSGAPGIGGHALCYDNTAVDFPPGYYGSVYRIFPALNAPFDSVRTVLDGFSLHNLRAYGGPPDNPDGHGRCANTMAIGLWIRKILGGDDWTPGPPPVGVWAERGFMFDRDYEFQYCPPHRASMLKDVGDEPGRGYTNALFQNYPNPFRSVSGTTIHYSVAKAGKVEVRIFDVAGRLLNTIVDRAKPGENFVIWDGKASDGRSVASGVYFYQIMTDGFSAQKKMMLIN